MSNPNIKNEKTGLSKSLYIRGLQCHKSLYLQKYHPELRDELAADLLMRFSQGHEVGELAQNLFPGGVLVTSGDYTLPEQLSMTENALASGATIIYEAAVEHDGVMARADIIKKTRGRWNLYEVKSSTDLKDVYLDDVAMQYNLLSKSGLHVGKAHVIHINNEYVRQGDINVNELFKIVDVTEAVLGLQDKVEKEIKELKKMLSGPEPDIDIGEHCEDPYDCDFMGHCWKNIPEDSVFSLKGRGVNRYDLYRKGTIKLADIPLEILNAAQRLQVAAHIDGKSRVDKASVKKFLDSLWYPIVFLDFETYTTAVPAYDGIRPYQQVPFQFSIHIIEKEGAEPEHFEYLGDPTTDSREELLQNLLRIIPKKSCVVAYTSFEKTILNSLGAWFPTKQKLLQQIVDNIRDLAEPFRRKVVYKPEMKGSYSIKYVLPSLVSDLKYSDCEIQNGGMAVEAYFKLRNRPEESEKAAIRKALLDYCKLDTYAMVKILDRLRSV